MRQSNFLSNQCKVQQSGSGLMFISPYNPAMVMELKNRIPYQARMWDNDKKAWIIDYQFSNVLVELANKFYGEDLALPNITTIDTQPELRLLDIRYLGQCKDRGDGNQSAYGFTGGTWGVIFPEDVLRTWFEAGPAEPGRASSYYGILGIGQQATTENIRGAFRRIARQWHPDVCKEPGATEQFILINNAYQVLNDPKLRGRYDAGLRLEASIPRVDTEYIRVVQGGYRSPLRCGYVMVEGQEQLGRFIVSKILKWEDIVMGNKTLVTSWPMGSKAPVELWI